MTETWTEEKVIALLSKLGIKRYTVDHEAKVISLYSLDDLFRVMNEVGAHELSESCRMSMMKWRSKVCLHAGDWQFEAEDTRGK
jgi:hypothetical protein